MNTPLTDHERELLRHIAMGETHNRIAHKRSRSPQTIKNTLTLIYEKLGAMNAPHAVYLALTKGLL